jgi:hypothetical protein
MLSEHLQLEIANTVHRGHQPGGRPPLAAGEPVPGCSCPACTGVRGTGVRPPVDQRRWSLSDRCLPVEEARKAPILELVARLDLGDPITRGKEARVRCPFHDDRRPSMRLRLEKGLWYCDPCAIGGDGISLVQRRLGVDFPTAVCWITAVMS